MKVSESAYILCYVTRSYQVLPCLLGLEISVRPCTQACEFGVGFNFKITYSALSVDGSWKNESPVMSIIVLEGYPAMKENPFFRQREVTHGP